MNTKSAGLALGVLALLAGAGWLSRLPIWLQLITEGAVAPLMFVSYLVAALSLMVGGLKLVRSVRSIWPFGIHLAAAAAAIFTLPLHPDVVFIVGVAVAVGSLALALVRHSKVQPGAQADGPASGGPAA